MLQWEHMCGVREGGEGETEGGGGRGRRRGRWSELDGGYTPELCGTGCMLAKMVGVLSFCVKFRRKRPKYRLTSPDYADIRDLRRAAIKLGRRTQRR